MALLLRVSPLLQLNARAAQSTIRLITNAPKQVKLTLFKQVTPVQLQKPVRLASTGQVSHQASKHWNSERLLSLALLAIIPGALIFENKVGDFLLSSSLILHSYWGFNVIFTDYIHGVTLPKNLILTSLGSVGIIRVAGAALKVVSLLAFVGLMYFNYTDMGLAAAIKRLWSL